MTVFIRCVDEADKQRVLLNAIHAYRGDQAAKQIYLKEPETFSRLPSSSISYWAPDSAISAFETMATLENEKRIARSTNDSGDDMRFVRASWEVEKSKYDFVEWRPLCKGGEFSRYYADVHLKVCWNKRKGTYLGFIGSKHRPLEKPASVDLFLRPGLTWSRRTALRLSMRAMPAGCNFGLKGPSIFYENDDSTNLLATLGITNSSAFYYFVDFQLAAANAGRAYDMGVIQRTPYPNISTDDTLRLAALAGQAWSSRRVLDSVNETSHSFLLPNSLFDRLKIGSLTHFQERLDQAHSEIEQLACDLYGFSEADRAAILVNNRAALGSMASSSEASEEDDEDEDVTTPLLIDEKSRLLSWAVGVAFGRFDWRLATGERIAPPEPGPFDRLPAKSPGMLPEGAEPFHRNPGILVHDSDHPHDLARLIEEVLARVAAHIPPDVRGWLQREFFPFHLQRYSKSRRKAPIYWPISTASGSYTLWIYYPRLTNQTLYTAINDFVEPKLNQIAQEASTLRAKVKRSREEDKTLETIQELHLELTSMRDELLNIAPTYRPVHDDGVQITAAPFWPLFYHRPWQKVSKDTWAKLEKGDYDWAHLAMAYWPERVRERCKTDKSLAIAHDLEHLYVASGPAPATTRSRKKGR